MHFKHGRSRLARLRQEGAARIRMPRDADIGCQAVLINTAGGLTGGDVIRWNAGVEAGAKLTVTTQACERIYRASGGVADVATTLKVDGTMAWLPQETILFDGCALSRALDAKVAEGATLLACESLIFGRAAMGETVRRLDLRDAWTIRRGGALVHAERVGMNDATALSGPGAGGGNTAFATVMLLGAPAEGAVGDLRAIVGPHGGVGFTGESGKLIVRLAAADGYALRRVLVSVLQRLASGIGTSLPKVWSL